MDEATRKELEAEARRIERRIAELNQRVFTFLRNRRAHQHDAIERPYERKGAHITVGRERPLADDFVPSDQSTLVGSR